MHVKCVFRHTEHVVLVCCERVITFVPEIIIIMRVKFSLSFVNNSYFYSCIYLAKVANRANVNEKMIKSYN